MLLEFLYLKIMYGITSLHELLFRLSVSHILLKTTIFGYAFLTKCVVILCLVGILFFVYATWFLVSLILWHHVFPRAIFSFKYITYFYKKNIVYLCFPNYLCCNSVFSRYYVFSKCYLIFCSWILCVASRQQ